MDPIDIEPPTKPQNTPITITFLNPSKSYFAGEMVNGTVRFQAQENQSVQTFSVQLRGEFYFKKDDVEQVKSIFTELSPMDYRGAGEGNVEVDFNLVLKPNCPTSLCSPLGGIRYRVLTTVVFSENDLLQMAEASEPISVNQPRQLPEDCSGRSASTVERGGVLCCISSISADLEVRKACLLSGQEAIINGSVINDTTSVIQGTAVRLVQSVQRCKDGKRYKGSVISLEKGPILPGKMQAWLLEYLVVPPLPPTSSDSYFKVWYSLVMEIQRAGGKLIKLKIPVTIGNVPSAKGRHSDLDSSNVMFEWKSSEPLDESNEFMPLYATYKK